MIRTINHTKGKTKPGPKTTYREEIGEKAYLMCLYGMTEKEIYTVLGISNNTWERWKRDREHLRTSLDKGKLPADLKVVQALFKRALGYEAPDTYWTTVRNEKYDSEGRVIERSSRVVGIPIKKHIPPDMKAIQMWLSNRSKGRWTTVTHHKVEHSGEVNHRHTQVDLKDFSTEELKILKKYAVLSNSSNN